MNEKSAKNRPAARLTMPTRLGEKATREPYAHFAPEQLRAATAKLATFSSTVPGNETPEATQGLE